MATDPDHETGDPSEDGEMLPDEAAVISDRIGDLDSIEEEGLSIDDVANDLGIDLE